MSKTKAIIGVCLIFIMGVVSGVAVTMRFVNRRIHAMVEGGPQVMGEVIVRRLDHQLHLDAGQRAQVQKIIEGRRGQVMAIRSQIQPQIAQITRQSTSEIRAILTPDQATKFDTIVEKNRNRWSRFHNGEPASTVPPPQSPGT